MEMIDERNWEEFRNTGLIWWINRSLHLFGWALVAEIEAGKVFRVYPARCRFRGFTGDVEDQGFSQLREYLKQDSEW